MQGDSELGAFLSLALLGHRASGDARAGTPRSSESMHDYVADLLSRDVPDRIEPGPPQPVKRYWAPRGLAAPAGRWQDRHPELDRCIIDSNVRPLRRLSRSSSHGWRGRVQSLKMGRDIAARSRLEFELHQDLEVDHDVTSFVEQPARLLYSAGGVARTLMPSAFAWRNCVPTILLAKWERSACRPENERRWEAAGAAIASLGFAFEIITERHLHRQPRLRNVRALQRGRFEETVDDELVQAAWRAAAHPEFTLADLLCLLPQGDVYLACQLIVSDVLRLDLDKPFCNDTRLWQGARQEVRG